MRLAAYLKKNKITQLQLAEILDISADQVGKTVRQNCSNLGTIALIHAYTLIPIEELLPLRLRKIKDKIKSIKKNKPTRLRCRAKAKVFLDSYTYPHNTIFEIHSYDDDHIILEINRTHHILNHPTFNEFFTILKK